MSKKTARKAANSQQASGKPATKPAKAVINDKSMTSALGVGVLFFAIIALVSVVFTYVMSAAIDPGIVFALVSAVVMAVCWYKGQASVKTLAIISVILGVCVGLFMGAIHIGIIYSVDGVLETSEQSGLEAIGMATGIAPLDLVRKFMMHLLYSTKYGMIFHLSFAGILDLFISIACYLLFMGYMVKRAVRS